MTNQTQTRESYQEQLSRWARALAVARNEEVHDALLEGTLSIQVALFTDGNLTKRGGKLRGQLASLAEAFDLEELAETYIRAWPLAAYDDVLKDGNQFLEWLERTFPLTPEQHDYVLCQRARFAVEDLARKNRLAHIRFQELSSLADQLAAELDQNPDLTVHLNPIRVWSRFDTPVFLDEETSPPAEVLFFAVGTDITTAVVESTGCVVIRELSSSPPRTLAQWACLSTHTDREELVGLYRDLASMGLVAFS